MAIVLSILSSPFSQQINLLKTFSATVALIMGITASGCGGSIPSPSASPSTTQLSVIDDTAYYPIELLNMEDVTPNSWINFSTILFTDVSGAYVSIEGGEYSLDGGVSYTSASGNVNQGQAIQVRHLSASLTNTETVTTLTLAVNSNEATLTLRSTTRSTYNNTLPHWVNNAQTSPAKIISNTADGANSVTTADVDGDGDLDVVSAYDNTIAWYENDGSADPAFIEHSISTTADGASSVTTADVDGDGDLDVLSASRWDNTIAWYENDGSADPVFIEHSISTTADGANSVTTADVDGDGHLDVLSAYGNTIAWYENGGSADPVFTEHSISTTVDGASWVTTADVDGDGDLDVLLASDNDDTIAWYENDGSADPVFTEHNINNLAGGASSVTTEDVDGDGDLDVLSALFWDDTIAWYENDGSADPVFTAHSISTRAYGARSVTTADVDSDGDLDVLSASSQDNTIAWYENDGSADPVFIEHSISTTADEATSVTTADIDGDGDLDVLSASELNDTIAWYRTTMRHLLVTEGSSLIATENASDANGNVLTYDVVSGPDAAYFTIDSATGELTFSDAPLTSAPEDFNGDNVYEAWISVSDGFSTLNRSIAVEVTPL